GLVVYQWGQRYLAKDPLSVSREQNQAQRRPLDASERGRVLALIALCALNVVFWAVYEQQGNTMQQWADKQTSWPVLFGWQVPSTWFQSVNPALIILLAPLLDMLWRYQARHHREPTSVTKMGMGCILLGLSFTIMIAAALSVGDGRGSFLWPIAGTVL